MKLDKLKQAFKRFYNAVNYLEAGILDNEQLRIKWEDDSRYGFFYHKFLSEGKDRDTAKREAQWALFKEILEKTSNDDFDKALDKL